MSKRIENRKVEIYYCDICGNECGLPYRGYDDYGYGDCCDNRMRKAKSYLTAINTIRRAHEIPIIHMTFENLKEVIIANGYKS